MCQQPLTVWPSPSGSLADNYLTNVDRDMSGVQSLAEALKENKSLEKLRCVRSRRQKCQ